MIRCAICDDNQYNISHISKLTDSYFKQLNILSDIKQYTDPRQLMFDVSDNTLFDIALLDIEMPYFNGLEIAKLIKEKHPNCLIVFLTSHIQYAIDAFELEVFRYIPKNEIDSRLFKCIDEASKIIAAQDNQAYIVSKNYNIEKIPYSQIEYARKSGKYTIIHCNNKKETKIRKPINIVKKELNSSDFVTIDRGCIVNITHISKLLNYDVYLKNGERLPVSRSNIKQLQKIIACYWEGIY